MTDLDRAIAEGRELPRNPNNMNVQYQQAIAALDNILAALDAARSQAVGEAGYSERSDTSTATLYGRLPNGTKLYAAPPAPPAPPAAPAAPAARGEAVKVEVRYRRNTGWSAWYEESNPQEWAAELRGRGFDVEVRHLYAALLAAAERKGE